jgi:hypothetical protein
MKINALLNTIMVTTGETALSTQLKVSEKNSIDGDYSHKKLKQL